MIHPPHDYIIRHVESSISDSYVSHHTIDECRGAHVSDVGVRDMRRHSATTRVERASLSRSMPPPTTT